MKYNLTAIMKRAWEIFKKAKHYHAETFGEALHRSWCEYRMKDEVREIITTAINASGITETVKTWFDWTLDGRKVMHDSETVLQVEIPYPAWGDGRTKILSYFTYSQTDLAENVL